MLPDDHPDRIQIAFDDHRPVPIIPSINDRDVSLRWIRAY